MPAFGVYPVADALLDGDEISSTYEGRHLTFLESELTHEPGLAFVTKGHPVVCGNIVGIPFKTCTAATDYVAVDTEGIWIVDVHAADDGGNIAVAGGDRLYINTTTCVVSKIATAASQIPFGYALGIIATPGNVERIAVKVHWDPIDNAVLDQEPLYFGDGREANLCFKPASMCGSTAEILELDCLAVPALSSALQIKAVAVAGTQDVGISAYFDATAVGVMTGNWVYGFGTWLNLDTTFDAPAGFYQIVSQSNGVYAAAVVDYATSDVIYGMKAEAILTAQPHGLFAFALNSSAQGSGDTAIFYTHNAETVGYTATDRTTQVGSLAIAYINGSGHDHVFYVNLYEA